MSRIYTFKSEVIWTLKHGPIAEIEKIIKQPSARVLLLLLQGTCTCFSEYVLLRSILTEAYLAA